MDTHELRNRFQFHPADTADKRTAHESIRMAFTDIADKMNALLKEGRAKSLCLTNLEEAMHWANSSIAVEGLAEKTGTAILGTTDSVTYSGEDPEKGGA